jgi:pyridoxal phosphate enzyme (YggS family)
MSQATGTSLQARAESLRAAVREAAISAGRAASDITIVAVSKTVDLAMMLKAYQFGFRHFGENRVSEARAKLTQPLPSDTVLHFIGQLQSNKAGHAVDLFDIIESVDRPSLIGELGKQAARRGIRLPVLLQVNVAGEDQKAGCAVTDARALAVAIASSQHLDLQGLMTMAPLVADPEQARPTFSALRELRDHLQLEIGKDLPHLSMGMSNDFPVAIQEGATHIRVGRALFG